MRAVGKNLERRQQRSFGFDDALQGRGAECPVALMRRHRRTIRGGAGSLAHNHRPMQRWHRRVSSSLIASAHRGAGQRLRAVRRLLPRRAVLRCGDDGFSGQAAAGAAYQVDTAEVSELGSCKVESWISSAGNHDVIASVSPACVVNMFRPVELSAQFTRARADGEWGTGVSPKVKTNIVPTAIGSWGVAISATAAYDLIDERKHRAVRDHPGHAAGIERGADQPQRRLAARPHRQSQLLHLRRGLRLAHARQCLDADRRSVRAGRRRGQNPASSSRAFSLGCATGRSINSTSI